MQSIATYILEKLNLPVLPEYRSENFSMVDDGSAEVEVLEFLYHFVRLIKPDHVLETGTYKGLSSSFIAQALKDNARGLLETLEIEESHMRLAKERWNQLGVQMYIDEQLVSSLEYSPKYQYEFMFLDSEPYLRFHELERYYDRLVPGGHLLVHDMPRSLCQGNVNPDHPEFKSWPVGEIPNKIYEWVKKGELTMSQYPTARGLVHFYKKHSSDHL